MLAKYCERDRRFLLNEDVVDATPEEIDRPNNLWEGKTILNGDQATFGNIECPIIQGAVAPISKLFYKIVYADNKRRFFIYNYV